MNDELYTDAYVKYRKELVKSDFCKVLPSISYDSVEKPKNNKGIIFVYSGFLSEYVRQLQNDINSFRRNLIKLHTWNTVIKEYKEDEKFALILEFIEPLAVLLHDLPYSTKNRFIFSLSHLCHQANRYAVEGWKDNLCNDKKINYKIMEKHCSNWIYFDKFKSKLSFLSGADYYIETNEYRNRMHHRIPINTEIGLSNFITRNIDDEGKVSYSIGHFNPIPLDKTIDFMKKQHLSMCECFLEYKKLLEYQVDTINEKIAGKLK